MKRYRKFIVSVLAVSAVSYLLQLAWIHIAEPIMESCGMEFGGILPTGDLIGAFAVILINRGCGRFGDHIQRRYPDLAVSVLQCAVYGISVNLQSREDRVQSFRVLFQFRSVRGVCT